MPRFVILTHDHPTLHWDLLLEAGPVLRAWRLDRPPASGSPVRAEAIPDHRLLYLDHEGPIGGDRGTVTQWDTGEFDQITDATDGLEFDIRGRRLSGRVALTHADRTEWQLTYVERPSSRVDVRHGEHGPEG